MTIFKKSAFLLSFIALSCISCGKNVTEYEGKTYDDYKEFQLEKIDDFYNADEGTYFLQFYFETCPYCKKVMPHLFRYLSESNNPKVYIFDIKSSSDPTGDTYRHMFKERNDKLTNEDYENLTNEMVQSHPSNIQDTYFLSVPSLYKITNHKLENFYMGSSNLIKMYDENLQNY